MDRLGSSASELEVDPSDPRAARQAPKRPITVTFVALLLFVVGAYNLVDGVVVLVDGGDGSKVAEGAFELAFGLLAITIGNGAFRMRRWAWAAFMALALVGLTNQLIREFFYDDTNYLALGLITLAVLALTPLDVQIAFRVRPPRNVLLDGLSIGPGHAKTWTPNVIDESTPWAGKYRGRWGLFAQDPISGANASAGPMYDRDGSPRPSWFNPLGFAGVDRVPPLPREVAVLEGEAARLEARQGELDRVIPEETSMLQELGVRVQSMQGSHHLAAEAAKLEVETAAQAGNVTRLRRERSENEAVLEGLQRQIERRRERGASDAPAHIRHAAEPVAGSEMRFDRVAELWAAVSMSLLLIGLAVLIVAAPRNVWAAITVLVIAFVVGESVLRGTFVRTVNRLAVILALVAVVVLLLHFWKLALFALLIALAIFLLYQRLRELRA